MATVRPAPGPRVGRSRRRPGREQRAPILNRELSWLEFNARVLHEARDTRNPLLERVKFLAIFASNLDEFFQVRVSGLRRQVRAGATAVSSDGMTPSQQLDAIRERVRTLVADHAEIWASMHDELTAAGVSILDYDQVPEHHEDLRRRFHDEIFPVLTPLAVDPGHPFPYISTLSLSIAVSLRDPESGESRFARVKIPPSLPRLYAVERDKFVLLDQVIEANLDELFRGMEIVDTHLFRVTRDADITVEEDEADDLLLVIEEEVRRRRFGEAVRLEVERSMPESTRQILIRGIGIHVGDSFEIAGMLDLTALWQLADLDRPDLKAPPYTPVVPSRLQPTDDDEPLDAFAQIRAGDILVHHPYESFTASVERFLIQAVNDPDVLTIKQTLYRTSGDSPTVQALIDAAGRGKQVVVLVEIKARFDEANNIIWARKLEQAGAHVVYGVLGLKTHCKVLLVVRREGPGLRRYVHIGTGNYNSKTARLYVDLGLLSCREELGADVTDLFNTLTGLSRQRVFRRLLVAPLTLRKRFLELVEREVAYAKSGHPARIVLKINSLVDTQAIEALYEASRAGVDVDLIVRGGCCLVPGIPGVSDRIRVRSIIGEFLEHSRIWMFQNGGRPEWFIGSADLMERNLDRRVEVVTPVEDHALQVRLARIIEVMLSDDRRSWQLQSSGAWLRTEVVESCEGSRDTFAILKADAATASSAPAEPLRPQAATGSMDPRA